jgi:hypothetical protein
MQKNAFLIFVLKLIFVWNVFLPWSAINREYTEKYITPTTSEL